MRFKVGDIIWTNDKGIDIVEVLGIIGKEYNLKSLVHWKTFVPGELDSVHFRGIDERYQLLSQEDRVMLL